MFQMSIEFNKPTKGVSPSKISITVNAGRTQLGKTTEILDIIYDNPATNAVIVIPNSKLALSELKGRIEDRLHDRDHEVFIITKSSDIKLKVTEVHNELIKTENQKQIVIIFMGNYSQLGESSILNPVRLSYQRGCEWSLFIDESDLFLFDESSTNSNSRDIHLFALLTSLKWKNVQFYTATIYSHVMRVFKEDNRDHYNLDIKYKIMEESPNYSGYEDFEYHDVPFLSMGKSFDTEALDVALEKMETLLYDRKTFGIHITAHWNPLQNDIKYYLLENYRGVGVILANQEGIDATCIADGKMRNRSGPTFKRILEAADWLLEQGMTKIFFIGKDSLGRMQTLTNSDHSLKCMCQLVLQPGPHAEGLIQLIGRLTGRHFKGSGARYILAEPKVISQIKQYIESDEYLRECVKKSEDGIITKKDLKDLPRHTKRLTTARKSEYVSKTSNLTDHAFEVDLNNIDEQKFAYFSDDHMYVVESGNTLKKVHRLNFKTSFAAVRDKPIYKSAGAHHPDGTTDIEVLTCQNPTQSFLYKTACTSVIGLGYNHSTEEWTKDATLIDNQQYKPRLHEAVGFDLSELPTTYSELQEYKKNISEKKAKAPAYPYVATTVHGGKLLIWNTAELMVQRSPYEQKN